MPLSSKVIRELAHGALKPLGTLADLLELYGKDDDKERGLHSAETRQRFIRSTRAVARGIMDLRLIAICDDAPDTSDPINWKALVHKNLPGSYPWHLSESLTWEGREENYEGTGHRDLLNAAVSNISWFAGQFWKDPAKVRLSVVEKEASEWISCEWDFGGAIQVDAKFTAFEPFYHMFPEKSLALDQSTGLALYAVKQILELHGGSLIAHQGGSNLRLEWICPKSNKKQRSDATPQ